MDGDLVAFAVFKTVVSPPCAWRGGFDSHTFPQSVELSFLLRMLLLVLFLLLLLAFGF